MHSIRAGVNKRWIGAKVELMTTDRGVGQIGLSCGFCDESHFVRSFRAQYGIGFGETGPRFDFGYDGREGTANKKRFVTNTIDSRMLFTVYSPFRTQVIIYDIDKPGSKDNGSLDGAATAF